MYKLVAIDIDATLLTDDIKITDHTKKTIRDARDKGAIIVLCTGRTFQGAHRFYKELDLDTLFITAGGAEIYDANHNKVFEKEVDPVLTKQVLEFAYNNGIHAQVYIDGELVFRERNKYSKSYEIPYGHLGKLVPDLLDIEKIFTPKVLYVLDADKAPKVQEEVTALFESLAVRQSKATYIEFSPYDVSKGVALEFIADYYEIDMQDIIAIGDSQIDAPMIEIAGLGVAVQNAPEDLKKIADVTCPSNEDDGVAYVIEKYILEA